MCQDCGKFPHDDIGLTDGFHPFSNLLSFSPSVSDCTSMGRCGYRHAEKSVVKVTAQFAKTAKVGTGFIVGQGKKHLFVVTASHVVRQKPRCRNRSR